MSAQTPEARPLLTAAEVAKIFRVDPKSVTRWAVNGKIVSIRTPGGHRRFRETVIRVLTQTPESAELAPLLTSAEVATMFHVDAKTVTHWAITEKIASIRTPGGHPRFRESEVRALMQTAEAEPLLTPGEAATMLHADTKTVTNWTKAGKLTFTRTLGGHRRFRETEVRALLAVIPQQRTE